MSARRHYARFFRKKGARFFIDAARGGLWLGSLLGAAVILENHPAFAAIVIVGFSFCYSLKTSADLLAAAIKGRKGNVINTEKLVVEAGDVADLLRLTASSVAMARAMGRA
jgi:hypothetical protein